MTKNHVSAEDLLTMTPADLDALTVDLLLLIQQEIVVEAARIKSIIVMYESVLNKKYGGEMGKAYIAKADAYGKATFIDGDYTIDVETPKNVKWDDDAMKAGEAVIRDDWKEDPEEYITYTRKIPEATFNAWPKAIQNVFSPARTIKPGKCKISIKLKEKKETK